MLCPCVCFQCVVCLGARATMQTFPCEHKVVCRKCFIRTIQVAVSQRSLPLRCVVCRARILKLRHSTSGTKALCVNTTTQQHQHSDHNDNVLNANSNDNNNNTGEQASVASQVHSLAALAKSSFLLRKEKKASSLNGDISNHISAYAKSVQPTPNVVPASSETPSTPATKAKAVSKKGSVRETEIAVRKEERCHASRRHKSFPFFPRFWRQ